MTITLLNPPRYDTRGLPEGMDPEKLFRYRYDTLASSAVGFESFLYKLMPYSLVRSFAFAIDPTYKFKVAPGTITAANRTKYRQTASVLSQRRLRSNHYLHTWSTITNYHGVSVCSSGYVVDGSNSSSPETVSALPSQPALADTLKDTTSRTRLIGSTQGELEFFKSTLISPPRTARQRQVTRSYGGSFRSQTPDCAAVGGVKQERSGGDEDWSQTIEPSAATLSLSTFQLLKQQEIAFCKELSSHYALPLLKAANPFVRDFSLTRNVAELKDLARGMTSLRQTADDLKKLWASLGSDPKLRNKVFDLTHNAASNLPKEYLSYNFGWKLLYKDLSDLLKLPERLSKRINFLIRRSGQSTTYRAERLSASSVSGVSGFTYTVSGYDDSTSTVSRLERESSTRIVINARFDFPPANVPHLSPQLFLDKIGVIPRFIDVYNIVPWSWLVDWFTGFGNYLEVIEEINHDPRLINWGMITSNTRGKLITDYTCRSRTRNILQGDFGNSTTNTFSTSIHTSLLEYECQTRTNVATAISVAQTTIPSSLTAYQSSILGAILAQRIDYTRSGSYRP